MSSLIQRMKEAKAKLKSASDREPTIKPKAGKNRFRILPSWRGDNEDFAKGFGSHFIKNESGEVKSVYICDAATNEKDCGVCDALNQAMISVNDDETKELIRQARASQRFLFNVIDIESDDNTPFILELSRTTYLKLVEIILLESSEEDPDFNVLTDLEAGHDIYIMRNGAGLKTEYTVSIVTKSTTIDKNVMNKIIDLDTFANQNGIGALNKSIAVINSLIVPITHGTFPTRISNKNVFEAVYNEAPFDDFVIDVNIEESSQEDLDEMLVDL